MCPDVRVIKQDGRSIVEINSIQFPGKRKIDWDGVERYLKSFVGKSYIIEESGKEVHIASDFPDEYANSKDSINSYGAIGKAKANAAQAISELIRCLSNITYKPNLDEKHKKDAPNGWYRGTVFFSIPVFDDNRNVIGKNVFRGRMVIRCGVDNKWYLYDIVTIKKET